VAEATSSVVEDRRNLKASSRSCRSCDCAAPDDFRHIHTKRTFFGADGRSLAGYYRSCSRCRWWMYTVIARGLRLPAAALGGDMTLPHRQVPTVALLISCTPWRRAGRPSTNQGSWHYRLCMHLNLRGFPGSACDPMRILARCTSIIWRAVFCAVQGAVRIPRCTRLNVPVSSICVV
jgi:hypothetical protein